MKDKVFPPLDNNDDEDGSSSIVEILKSDIMPKNRRDMKAKEKSSARTRF